MKVLQVNLQHSKAASAVLCRMLASGLADLALVQEPWLCHGKIKGLRSNGGVLIYDTSSKRPRTVIVVNRKVDHIQIHEHCSSDLVTVRVRVEGQGSSEWVSFCSAYLPYDSIQPPPSRELRSLVGKCEADGEHLIIGCDSNCHHTNWGSSNINRRGENLVDYILSTNLITLNVGNEPTFVTTNRREVLDITLATRYISNLVTEWHVSSEPSCSDHRHICFNVGESREEQVARRNPRNTDWDTYQKDLANNLSPMMEKIKTAQDIELGAEFIKNAIESAFVTNCRQTTAPHTVKVPWWSGELDKLRKKVRRLFNVAKRDGSWDFYRRALTKYNLEIRKAKRISWRRYCQEIESTDTVARLHRIMKRDTSGHLGTLKSSDGQYTKTTKETLELLLRTHFPGSGARTSNTAVQDQVISRTLGSREDWRAAKVAFNFGSIKYAINGLKAYKAPGPDGIYPAFLQYGGDELICSLCRLFRASFALGYIPRTWRQVEVIFIPKAGRTNYEQPKAFRPISLTSFLLKTAEKIIDKEIRGNELLRTPLHSNQHAYQAGKSVETALHNLVYELEEAVLGRDLAFGIFIDIEGAFDRTSFDVVMRAMQRRDIGATTIRWIDTMLRSRELRLSLHGETVDGSPAMGCPQGGVLSPLLWCLVVDEALDRLTEAGFYAQAYADDVAIVIKCVNTSNISNLLQTALDVIET